jgi:hypothetical protein
MDADSTRISRPELITVDLRGMKAALLTEAHAHGVSPSDFVRSTLAKAMGPAVRSVADERLGSPIQARRPARSPVPAHVAP